MGPSSSPRRSLVGRRAVVPALSGALLLAVATAAPAHAASIPTTTTSPSATVQLDGKTAIAWTQVVVGSTVYVGGSFTHVRPAGKSSGESTTSRTDLMAYDINTGDLKSWAPTANGQVLAMTASSDGKTIYIGGDFTSVSGSSHSRIAAISASTGKVVSGFKATVNKTVTSLSRVGTKIYAGGKFSSANGSTRDRTADFDGTTGKLLAWAPDVDDTVQALVGATASGTTGVVIGGRFAKVNGKTEYGTARVDSVSGKSDLTWKANTVVENHGDSAGIYSLSSDGSSVYATGDKFQDYGSKLMEGMFKASWASGTIQLLDDCHGDTYSAATDTVNGAIFTASHAHDCSNIGGFGQSDPEVYRRGLEFEPLHSGTVKHNTAGSKYSDFAGQPAAKLVDWYPYFSSGDASGKSQGPWSVVVTKDWVVYAGEFTSVGTSATAKNGHTQQGLVRFKR